MNLHPVELQTLTPEVLRVFGAQPPLLTAGDKSGCNTMTIGWCQMGQLWSLPVCTVYVRPERHTFSFMESSDYLCPAEGTEADHRFLRQPQRPGYRQDRRLRSDGPLRRRRRPLL